jgi:hypothetical protein
MDAVNPAGAQKFNDPHVMGVLKPHGTRHVGRRIGTIGTYHGYNFGFKFHGCVHRFMVHGSALPFFHLDIKLIFIL